LLKRSSVCRSALELKNIALCAGGLASDHSG
jgi:hypothetical protein